MSTLATGWFPWGVKRADPEGFPHLSLCGKEFILCCGHVLRRKEAAAFVAEGLLEAGPPDRFGREMLVITDAGRQWLRDHW
jgi:hypothetical protein